jgi:predicted DNA-binding transcriptional regulator AlpA
MDLAGVVAALEALDLEHAPPEALVPVLAACAATEARIAVRLATASAEPAPAEAGSDRYLTVREAAARVGMKPQYIYENKATLPFVVRVGNRAIRVSERRLARYMANRTRL